MKSIYKLIVAISLAITCSFITLPGYSQNASSNELTILHALHNHEKGTISILRNNNSSDTLLVQNAQEEIRPFIHPIVAPDGTGILTEYRPEHHTHQTGLYWGLKMVNGRDFFMDCCKPGTTGYHRKVSADVIIETGTEVTWETIYDLLDRDGNTMLTETHNWSMQEKDGTYIIDLIWEGHAKTDITFGEFYVGGLFLRMQWYRGIDGEVVNASGQRNQQAEAQRSIWADVGIQVDGRNDRAHIAMFDHPDNNGFPIPWRVDSQLGVGPSRQIMGDWLLNEGETEIVRYRLIVYTGELGFDELTNSWTEFAVESAN